MTTTVTYSIELQHRATHPATTKRGNNARMTNTLKRRFTAISITYTQRQKWCNPLNARSSSQKPSVVRIIHHRIFYGSPLRPSDLKIRPRYHLKSKFQVWPFNDAIIGQLMDTILHHTCHRQALEPFIIDENGDWGFTWDVAKHYGLVKSQINQSEKL